MLNKDAKLLLRKLMIEADFEVYDAQPEHIRYIMREHGVSVEVANMIHNEESK